MGRKSNYNKDVKLKTCEDYEKGKESFNSIATRVGVHLATVRLPRTLCNSRTVPELQEPYAIREPSLNCKIENAKLRRMRNRDRVLISHSLIEYFQFSWKQ